MRINSTFNNKWAKKFDIRPHRRHTRMVQLYLPGGTNVHCHLMYGSLGPPQSTSQTACRLVQPFLHGSWLTDHTILNNRPHLWLTDWVVVLCPTQHKIDHFGHVPQANILSGCSFNTVVKPCLSNRLYNPIWCTTSNSIISCLGPKFLGK